MKTTKSVYDESQQSYRVSFACQALLNYAKRRRRSFGVDFNPSRKFESCFEMGDGEQVIAKIYARALKNERLMEALSDVMNIDKAKSSYEKHFPIQSEVTQ